jgi:hypothetical protein
MRSSDPDQHANPRRTREPDRREHNDAWCEFGRRACSDRWSSSEEEESIQPQAAREENAACVGLFVTSSLTGCFEIAYLTATSNRHQLPALPRSSASRAAARDIQPYGPGVAPVTIIRPQWQPRKRANSRPACSNQPLTYWCWLVPREDTYWLIAGGWFVLREKYS